MNPLPLPIILLLLLFPFFTTDKVIEYNEEPILEASNISIIPKYTVFGIVSAYNSVPEQTDNTPCIGAGGYICGRNDVVANNCLPLGTIININGKDYEVFDRMNSRYGCEYYDIFMGMDMSSAKEFGIKNLEIIIYK